MPTTLSHADSRKSETILAPSSPATDRGTGVYPNAETRAALMAIYDARLARWPIPFEEIDVRTRYGQTHVVTAGERGAPPLLLAHMMACPAFMWGPIIEPLARHFRIFALDTIGDIGKSNLDDSARYPKRGEEYSEWLGDVADALDIEMADVVAASMGGWIAQHHAAHSPERVRRLVLLAPMGLPSWIRTMRTLSRMMAFALRPSPSKKEEYLRFLMGDNPVARAEAGEWMSAMLDARCMPRVGFPFSVAGTTLAAIRAPTFIVLGGRDELVGNAEKAARRARDHIPNVEIEILPDAAHGVFIEEPERVATRILEFLETPV